MWGLRVIIPESLRGRILDELHNKHPGISRMKGLARIMRGIRKSMQTEKRYKIVSNAKRCLTLLNQFHLTHGIGLLSQWNESIKISLVRFMNTSV